jgi:hypothetical protein
MEAKNMSQSRESIAVPKALIDGLASITTPFGKIRWVFEWLASNPSRGEELGEVLLQLDSRGMKMFGRSLGYHHCNHQGRDPVQCAKGVLKHRILERRINEIQAYFQTHSEKKITLANGLQCTIVAQENVYGWYAIIMDHENTKIRLDLWIGQLVSLEDCATKNIGSLKRLRPRTIEYLKEGKWQSVNEGVYRSVMLAIAEKMSIGIAPLL